MNWVSSWVLKMAPKLRLEQFEGLQLVLPEITFTGKLELELGGVRFSLLYAGGGHTRDSAIVHLPTEKILFLSDALYPNPEGKITKLAPLCTRLERLEAETLIPGHEMPYEREKLTLRAEYYSSLVQTAQKLRRRKAGFTEVAQVALDSRYAQINGLNEKRHRELLRTVWNELSSD